MGQIQLGERKMINKKEFFDHMSTIYDDEYDGNNLYRTLKSLVKIKNNDQIQNLREMVLMDHEQRLFYRSELAANGKELTPTQVDQYISMVEYALSHINLD